MIQKVTLPALGETVDTSTIERWVKQEGDTVAKGDVLCEITTDKATLEVESYFEGTLLKTLAPAGAELPVGALIAVIGDPGEEVPSDVLAEAEGQGGAAQPAAAPAQAETSAPPTAETPPAPVAEPAQPAEPAPAAPAAGDLPEGLHQVTMPALGETVDVSTIERWVKAEGDAVAKGDVLCEITTDKATLEVESYFEGTLLKILAPAGVELPVGAPMAVIGPEGAEVPAAGGAEQPAAAPSAAAPSAPPAEAEAAAPAPATAAAAAPAAGGRVFAAPRARRRARELGVALESVTGTGPGGRIIEADVAEAAEAARAVKASPLARKAAASGGVDLATVQGTGPGGKVMRTDVAAAAAPAVRPGEVVPLSKMRRIVAERMAHSKQTIPCYYLTIDVDMTEAACLRAKLNQKANGQPKVSFNDLLIKACGRALKQFPAVNSRWVEGGIERRGVANVGLAVALEEGLMVPVVRDADAKDLRQIARETADFAQRARSKRLTPDEYQDGCMTVTNLGMFGIRDFIPVVNPGESCIMGVGVIQDRVVFRQGGIQVRQMMTITLSVDHRLVDGAVAAQFLETVRDLLESPQPLAKV
ncbi:MAG: 2-oxo acid dehydrogenase subunit E2 [Phycisphaerae bacterium]